MLYALPLTDDKTAEVLCYGQTGAHATTAAAVICHKHSSETLNTQEVSEKLTMHALSVTNALTKKIPDTVSCRKVGRRYM